MIDTKVFNSESKLKYVINYVLEMITIAETISKSDRLNNRSGPIITVVSYR